ncbi:polymer-forming cytoskeletal protein [Candidatus Margulisiibacteriota bacterium]
MGIFKGENKERDHGAVDSIIGAKAKFKGEVISSGAISVNGEFEGKLFADGEVIISKGSRVTGDVRAGSVVVSGKVNGNIAASQSLDITKSGKVHGDLVGGRIMIEDGASYRGKVSVEAQAVEEEEIVEEEDEVEIVKA